MGCPSSGRLKINMDWSFLNSGADGFGVLARDDTDRCDAVVARLLQFHNSDLHAEAEALRGGIILGQHLHWLYIWLPMDADVDLSTVADMTEGFSGADLQALVSDAQLSAVHEILEGTYATDTGRKPVISDALLKSTASKTRPSVSDSEKKKLYEIYGQFLDSKKSAAAQLIDAKGKRATLA